MAGFWGTDEANDAKRLIELNLPPITSVNALATMLGVNPGLIWSIRYRPHRYYRSFNIPKGKGSRQIDAPRVLLKIIQKWISVHLQHAYIAPNHVHGFVSNKSHITAATVHCGARWVLSVDITNFFPSTPNKEVILAFQSLGYSDQSANLLTALACFRGGLAQGAPTSPVLSNICMNSIDEQLALLATKFKAQLTRYADDIVFSGTGEAPIELIQSVHDILSPTPWSIAENKVSLNTVPARLKVHGLLVHGNTVRLTKGYRNKIRAYQHLLNHARISPEDLSTIQGHLSYSRYLEKIADTQKR